MKKYIMAICSDNTDTVQLFTNDEQTHAKECF